MLSQINLTELNRWQVYALTLLLILASISTYFYLQSSKRVALDTGAILVLPVKMSVKTPEKSVSERRSSYAEMDQLIRQLGSSEHYLVLETEDVVEVMRRASTSEDVLTFANMENIFKVSGVSLIVETEVFTHSEGSKLSYRLYKRQGIDSGHFSGTDLQALFTKLSSLINLQTGADDRLSIDTANDSRFASPDMVLALEQLQSGQLNNVISSLERVVIAEPFNVTAKRILANILIDNREFTTAGGLLTVAIEQAKTQDNNHELARLRLSLANNLVGQNEIERALPLLSMAKVDAAKEKDWLYIAYIFELSGHINQRLNRYAAAREQFKKSIYYHQKIQCPYGQVQGQNNLAKLELLERNYSKAYRLTKHSLDTITMRDLPHLREQTLKLHTKIENKL